VGVGGGGVVLRPVLGPGWGCLVGGVVFLMPPPPPPPMFALYKPPPQRGSVHP
jgi:hypothetical protein